MRKMLMMMTATCVCMSSMARIHDTPTECAERYGQPVNEYKDASGLPAKAYAKDGLLVNATFRNGRVSQIIFGHRGVPLSDAEIQSHLSANADGKWSEVKMESPDIRLWSSAGTGMQAMLTDQGLLSIMDKDALEAMRKQFNASRERETPAQNIPVPAGPASSPRPVDGKVQGQAFSKQDSGVESFLARFAKSCTPIERVFLLDEMFEGSDPALSKLQFLREKVDHIKGIDTSACPVEFRTAWLAHAQAWEKLYQCMSHLESKTPIEALVEGAIRGAQGDFSGGYLDTMKEVRQLSGAVDDARDECDRIAVKGGSRTIEQLRKAAKTMMETELKANPK